MAAFDWRARLCATLVHLGFSAFVAVSAAAVVFLVWFPEPFGRLAGGVQFFALIVCVHLVLGPLITSLVFDRSKGWTKLKFDLFVIVLLQLAALGYGMYTMYIVRPVVMALEGDRFRVVTAMDVLQDELPQAQQGLQNLSLLGPVFVRTLEIRPEDNPDALSWALKGYDVGTRPRYWRRWDNIARKEARAVAKPVTTLAARYPSRLSELDAALKKTQRIRKHLGFLPVISFHADAVAFIDLQSGDIVGYASFDGF